MNYNANRTEYLGPHITQFDKTLTYITASAWVPMRRYLTELD